MTFRTFCNATQPHITTQCLGLLGGTVEVQLPKGSQYYTYRLKKDNVRILLYRYSFTVSTGMISMKDLNWSDHGTYSIEVHDYSGVEMSNTQFHLSIQGE